MFQLCQRPVLFILSEILACNGCEEKRIAEEKGSFHEGVPAITVIVDIMPSQALALSLERRQESCFILESAISTVIVVREGFLNQVMFASKIGANLHRRWKVTLFWRVFWRQLRFMEFATPNL